MPALSNDESDDKSRQDDKLNKQQQTPEQQDKQPKKVAKWFQTQTELMQQISNIEKQIEKLKQERSEIPYKIKVSQMPPECRYNKLEQESKHLQNIIKMICYRAETALANLIAPHYAGQQHGNTMRTLKSFFVKYDRKIREAVQDFCKYYRHHKEKTIIYYYDTTALGSNYAVNDEDFKTVVCDEFEKQGWTVTPVYIGNPMGHMEKWLLISQALMGHSGLLPLFNEENNEALLLAMQQAGTRNGPEGFKKDKLGEKLAETEEDKLEYRTDGTDAWDTLFIGMNKFPQLSSIGFVTSSFMSNR